MSANLVIGNSSDISTYRNLSLENPGCIIPWGGSSIPSGFLRCDGSAISRNIYSRLYAEIGTTWGVGDGVNTFNIPNLILQMMRGKDNGIGRDAGGDRAVGNSQSSSVKIPTAGLSTNGITHGSEHDVLMYGIGYYYWFNYAFSGSVFEVFNVPTGTNNSISSGVQLNSHSTFTSPYSDVYPNCKQIHMIIKY